MLSQVFDFLTTILFGRIAFKLFEWLSNPANTDKIISIFRFIKDWWPLILGGIIAFLPGLLGPVGLIIGTIALVTWGIIKITDAIKSIFGFGPKIDKELKSGSDKFNKDIQSSGKDAESKLEPGKDQDDDMPDTGNPSDSGVPAEISGAQDSQAQVQNLNKGGEVQGSGDKDTVPAMLTPGEFVMSKGAVEQYGVNTLEGMNAAAGGTNIPTVQKGGDKGMNLSVPRFSGGGVAASANGGATSTTASPAQQMVPGSPTAGGGKGNAGVVTDPKERQQQEAYMLKYVNEERAFQGLPPLTNLTYAPGVELTKMRGPGPRTKETSNTVTDLDKGFKTTTKSKTVDGKTTFSGGMSLVTQEDRDKFFAENPHAAQLVKLKDQIELDNLGADISASAKMNGGGLVQGFTGGGLVSNNSRIYSNSSNSISNFNGGGLVSNNSRIYSTSSNSISNFNGGGLVQKFNQGGIVNQLPQVKAAKWLGNKAKGAFNFAKEKIAQVSSDQKPRVDHLHLDPPKRPSSKAAAAQVAQSSGDAATVSNEKAAGLPPIDASSMRSQSKIRTLGLSV